MFNNTQINLNVAFQQAFQLQQNGKLQDAMRLYQGILKSFPAHIGAKTMLGTIYVQTENDLEGIKLLKSSTQRDPKQFWAFNALGVGHLNLQHYQEAIFSFNRAIALKPDYVEAYFNLGKTQRALHQYQDAIDSYSKCIALNERYPDAYNNRGTIYSEDLKQYERALADYQKFIDLAPKNFFGYYNLGNTLKALDSLDDALACYCKSIELYPQHAESHFYCGNILVRLKQYDQALTCYERVINLDANIECILSGLIQVKMILCDWSGLQLLLDQLKLEINESEKAASPFVLLGLIDDPELQKNNVLNYVKLKHPAKYSLPAIQKSVTNNSIRIGYFSGDFHNHATMHLMAELFEAHDKNKFELIGFSFGPELQDEWRNRAVNAFDKFIDVRSKSDLEVAELARNLHIDIAIDLKGYTQDSRTGIFAYRAAPIQVNYLGYPGTMGSEYIDYIIADSTVIPKSSQQYYSEKIVYLPNSYQVNVSNRVIAEKIISRDEVGLPENGFVFCCFNNNWKITPDVFDGWMRILNQVKSSVLWLFKSNDSAAKNLSQEAKSRGIDPSRIIFAPMLPIEQHLKRIQLADLFLDTLPYNAHTTSSDALRIGLPVLTLIGKSFAGRVAASLLNTVGLPELITTHQDAYESLAITLATNPVELDKIKQKLKNNLQDSTLFNAITFTAHIESAYSTMYQRYQADLPPTNLVITERDSLG